MVLNMAIFSVHAKIIGRSKGRSSVSASAYRAGEKIKNERTGLTHNFKAIQNRVVFEKIFLPKNAPEKLSDRYLLWNEVEAFEKAKNAQYAREIMFALPREFNQKQRNELIQNFVKNEFVAKGMIADLCIHDSGDGNPHAHVMLTTRSFKENGEWDLKKKKVYELDANGNKQYDPNKRTYKCRTENITNWNTKDFLQNCRANWATAINKELKKINSIQEVTHKSYKEVGVDKMPTKHLSLAEIALEKKGIETSKGDFNRIAKEFNQAKENYLNAVNDQRYNSASNIEIKNKETQLIDAIQNANKIIFDAKSEMNKLEKSNENSSIKNNLLKSYQTLIEEKTFEIGSAKLELYKSKITVFPEFEKNKNSMYLDENNAEKKRIFDASFKLSFRELAEAKNDVITVEKEMFLINYKLEIANQKETPILKFELAKVTESLIDKQAIYQKLESAYEHVKDKDFGIVQSQTKIINPKEMLKKRDWKIEEIKDIDKKYIQESIANLKVEYAKLDVALSKKFLEYYKQEIHLNEKRDNIGFAFERQKVYTQLQDDRKMIIKNIDCLKADYSKVNVFNKLSGKAEEIKQKINVEVSRLNKLDQEIDKTAKVIYQLSGLNVYKQQFADQAWYIKNLDNFENISDKKLSGLKKEHDELERKTKEKRIEIIEKIFIAKDQNKLDHKDCSMQEIRLDSLETGLKYLKNDEFIQNMTKKDIQRIEERHKKGEISPKEKNAIDKAMNVHRQLNKAFDKAMSIAEDNVR